MADMGKPPTANSDRGVVYREVATSLSEKQKRFVATRKLSDRDVAEMMALRFERVSYRGIAERFGVSVERVRQLQSETCRRMYRQHGRDYYSEPTQRLCQQWFSFMEDIELEQYQ